MRDVTATRQPRRPHRQHDPSDARQGPSGPGQSSRCSPTGTCTATTAPPTISPPSRSRTTSTPRATRSLSTALRSPPSRSALGVIAEPLRVLDCTPTTDGAAAVVLASTEWARDARACRTRCSRVALLGRPTAITRACSMPENDYLGFRATREAARVAYRQAGIDDPRDDARPRRVPRLLHDHRDHQLRGPRALRRGEGWKLLREGATTVGGDIPVNLSGGLQSCGHPVGATGVRVVKEVADQVTRPRRRPSGGGRSARGSRTRWADRACSRA